MGTKALESYRKALRSHDWFFEFSDDRRVWERETANRRKLERLRAELDPTGEIWNSIAPEEMRKVPQIDAALAAPAKLTDEQIDAIFEEHKDAPTMSYRYLVARAIERALEKRNG